MVFWWIMVHNLLCPIHSSHKFIIVVNYLWLNFSYFHFVCSISTIFSVWRVEINFTSRLCHHTLSEIGIYICKQTVHFSCILFFHSFPEVLLKYSLCMREMLGGGPNSWLLQSPDIMPLNVLLWGCVKDYVCRTSVDDKATLLQG